MLIMHYLLVTSFQQISARFFSILYVINVSFFGKFGISQAFCRFLAVCLLWDNSCHLLGPFTQVKAFVLSSVIYHVLSVAEVFTLITNFIF